MFLLRGYEWAQWSAFQISATSCLVGTTSCQETKIMGKNAFMSHKWSVWTNRWLLTNLSCLMERMILLPSPAAVHVCLHAAWSRMFHLWHTAFPVFQPKLNEIFSSFPGASIELFIASLTFSRSQDSPPPLLPAPSLPFVPLLWLLAHTAVGCVGGHYTCPLSFSPSLSEAHTLSLPPSPPHSLSCSLLLSHSSCLKPGLTFFLTECRKEG